MAYIYREKRHDRLTILITTGAARQTVSYLVIVAFGLGERGVCDDRKTIIRQ